MTADVTPTSFSRETVFSEADGIPFQRFSEIVPTTSTAFVTSVNQTGEAMFGRAIIETVSFTVMLASNSTYQVTTQSTSYQYTVNRVVYSVPNVNIVTVTQYMQVVPTNTTVWNSSNSPSSLLLVQSGAGNDVVSYKVAVVSDTVV